MSLASELNKALKNKGKRRSKYLFPIKDSTFRNKDLIEGNFNLEIGQLFCLECSTIKIKDVDFESIKILKFLMTNHINDINKKINFDVLEVINNLLYKFISFHLPEIRKSKLFITKK